MNRSFTLIIMLLSVVPASTTSAELFRFQGSSPPVASSSELLSHQYTERGPIYEFRPEFEAVIRGQSPQTYDMGPQTGQPGQFMADPYGGGGGGIMMQPGGMPPGATYGSPYGGMPSQPGYDPFMASPYAGTAPDPYGTTYGVNGPQPVRLGWSTRWDFAYLPSSDLVDGGEVSSFEVDWAMDYTTQVSNGWIWTYTPQFDYRQYDFQGSTNPMLQPAGPGDPGVADNYYRFGYRFQATSPQAGPLSWRLGFTPAVASDLQSQLNSQAWNFDVDITAYYRTSPSWMWVAGVLYWDRAEDFILPHAGAVWNPNEFWEIRAVFPNPRADVFVGTPFGIATWLYAGGEYNVESFQAGEINATKAQLQVEELRAFAGLRWEACTWSSYLDFGYAFNRKWNIHSNVGTSDLAPDDTFMIRYGLRY